jgi:hypothetical protein
LFKSCIFGLMEADNIWDAKRRPWTLNLKFLAIVLSGISTDQGMEVENFELQLDHSMCFIRSSIIPCNKYLFNVGNMWFSCFVFDSGVSMHDSRVYCIRLQLCTINRFSDFIGREPWSIKAHFHSGKFSAERKFCKMWSTFNNDIFGKFSVCGNFSWVEMGLEWTEARNAWQMQGMRDF